jgi:hypothetical protein
MQNLNVIVYASCASSQLAHHELAALLEASRRRNLEAGITGLLLHADGNFVQYLEGEPAMLAPIWASIRRDQRHHSVRVLLDGRADRREFEGWSMAYGNSDVPDFLSPPATDGRRPCGVVLATGNSSMTPGRALLRAMWAGMLPGTVAGTP